MSPKKLISSNFFNFDKNVCISQITSCCKHFKIQSFLQLVFNLLITINHLATFRTAFIRQMSNSRILNNVNSFTLFIYSWRIFGDFTKKLTFKNHHFIAVVKKNTEMFMFSKNKTKN